MSLVCNKAGIMYLSLQPTVPSFSLELRSACGHRWYQETILVTPQYRGGGARALGLTGQPGLLGEF